MHTESESLTSNRFPVLFVSLLLFIAGIHIFSHIDDKLIVNIAISQFILASMYTLSVRDRMYKITISFAVAFIGLRWFGNISSSSSLSVITILMMTIYFGFLVKGVITFLLTHKTIDTNVILGTITAYMMIGILFSFINSFLIDIDPMSFENADILEYHDILYYTMVSYTTIGFGDMLPITSVARMVAYSSGIVGQMYMGIVTAIIVGKFLQGRQ